MFKPIANDSDNNDSDNNEVANDSDNNEVVLSVI